MLEARGIVVNTPDSLVGTAYSISANGRFIGGWNGPYVFGYGFVIDLQEVLSTTNTPQTLPLSIVPNPAAQYIRLQNFDDLDAAQTAAARPQLAIVDVLGKTVLTKNVTDFNAPVYVSDLPSGVYIATLKTAKHTFVNKLIVNH